MTGTLIATTPKASVHALAFQGIMVYSCYPQIRDMLIRKFGDDYALLFAKPVENTQTSEIDWYTPIYGEARKLADLPEQARNAACEKAAQMAKEIRAYAEELIHSPDSLKVTRGNILRLALCYPDDNYLYVIGEQPVFICWGFGPGTPGVEPKDLTRLAPEKLPSAPKPSKIEAAPIISQAPVSRPPRSFGWLWWLLPLLAACLLFLFLFTSFGGQPPFAGYALFHGPALSFLERPQDRGAELSALEADIHDLRMRLDQHAALCMPEEKPAMPPEQPVPAPAIPIKPEPAQEGEALVIPEQSKDPAFLEGEWLCDTGLANMRTAEPVKVLFMFGDNGSGKATIFEKNDKCEGRAAATIQNGELRINVDEQKCAKSGSSYSKISIICTNAAGANAQCAGLNPDGSKWSADFKRIR